MDGRSYESNTDVICGFLTMTVPALKKTAKSYSIPKFLEKKAGGGPVCAAEWTPGGPEPLYMLIDGKEVPWEQDTDVDFTVAKEKELIAISYQPNGLKTFYKIKAEGVPAKYLHLKCKKGDKVVIFGQVTKIGKFHYIHAEEIMRVMD